jgi:hypothetical protein
MHALPRRLGAGLLAAIAVLALAFTMTARADAATTTVEIVTKATINGIPNRLMDRRGDHTITNPDNPGSTLKWFIKEDVGQAARYKNYPTGNQCLTAPPIGRHITMEPCDFSPNQLWTQGFQSGPFRDFHNVGTGRSATAEEPRNHQCPPDQCGFYAEVVQSFFAGNANQLWQVRPAD